MWWWWGVEHVASIFRLTPPNGHYSVSLLSLPTPHSPLPVSHIVVTSYHSPVTTLRFIHRQCSKALSLHLNFTAPISIPFLPSLLSPSPPFLLPLSLPASDVAVACHSEFMKTSISASIPSPRLVSFFFFFFSFPLHFLFCGLILCYLLCLILFFIFYFYFWFYLSLQGLKVSCAVSEPLKVMISGAPASGKGTQCEMIVQKVRLLEINFWLLIYIDHCFVARRHF